MCTACVGGDPCYYGALYLNTVCIDMSTVVAKINIVQIEIIRDRLIEVNGYNN